jgi:hypothetical protein
MRLAERTFPLERLSPTSLSLFASCPEQFRQRYLLRRPDVQFGDRFMGGVNHETVADVLRMKQQDGGDSLRTADEDAVRVVVRDFYRSAWERKLEEDGEPDWKEDDPVEQYARGLAMALRYVQDAVPSIQPLAVEEKIEVRIPGVPLVRGYVDVIEQDKIRERKTTRAKVTSPSPKWRFQGRVYQFITGLPVEWDVLTRQVEPKLYMAEEHPDLRMEASNNANTVRLIKDLWWHMNDLYQRRGTDETWPMYGFHDPWLCSYCAIGPKYGSTCPAWS